LLYSDCYLVQATSGLHKSLIVMVQIQKGGK